ncbi:MAG: deoxynucleoside kinase, partial [Deltaproteobacteria bacterium]|nr:deoxynucleoside kinase [Deltaproteobacteria bacterium]
MSSYRYIVVEGVIGVGKTTLVELLSRDFKAKTYLEIVEENPFLVKGFYEDIAANAFNTEIFFLLSRFRQQRQLTDDLLHSTQLLISASYYQAGTVSVRLISKISDLTVV